jgi:hypothetical protein
MLAEDKDNDSGWRDSAGEVGNGVPLQVPGQVVAPVSDDDEPGEMPAIAEMLLSTKKPKNLFHGAMSAGSNVLTGALGGAALMVAGPVVGARQGMQEGGGVSGACKGFGLGLFAGIVGGASLMVGGAATGAYQLGRGLYNTKVGTTISI